MNRSGSALKWVLVLVLLAAAGGVLAWRLGAGQPPPTAPTMLICQGCGFVGQAEVPVEFAEWPFTCPKCQAAKALPAQPCPACGKLIPWNPKAPPAACPLCKAPLADEAGP